MITKSEYALIRELHPHINDVISDLCQIEQFPNTIRPSISENVLKRIGSAKYIIIYILHSTKDTNLRGILIKYIEEEYIFNINLMYLNYSFTPKDPNFKESLIKKIRGWTRED